MPQIMIDTLAASPAQMRMTAKFLEQMAEAAEALTRGAAPAAPSLPQELRDRPMGQAHVQAEGAPSLQFGAPLPAGASLTPPQLSIVPPPPPPVPTVGVVQVPPPPSPPALPVQTAATPAVLPAISGADPVELDSEGFPYDERIHSAGDNRKKKTGEWKYKRGMEATTIQVVEAELRAKGYGVKPAATPPPPPVQSSFVPPPPPPPPPQVQLPGGTVGAPPPPFAGQIPAGPAASPVEAFRDLMKRIAPHMAPNGKLALSILTPIYTKLGVKGLEDFAKPGAPVAAMNAEVNAILGVA